ncbi:MAG: DUF2339 domain-containing protein [Actinobacteria bacterium]|nr:DUF2339 domain-containing protein [Actinomycetota bacterium]
MERERLERLETRYEELAGRVALLELERPRPAAERALEVDTGGGLFAPRVRDAVPLDRTTESAAPPLLRTVDPPAAPAVEPPTLRERLGVADDPLEDLLGGRVLAWVGSLAVFLGLLFLLAIAISRGWLGEGARVALAALASSGLIAGGAWLHERTARVDAARAAAAAGIAGLFATATVATRLYALVPEPVGLAMALLIGACATMLALRWDSRGLAALGILGAVAAPLLVGAGHAAGTLALLFVALASATGVLLWRRWDWLALAAFALAAPQWIPSLFDGASTAGAAVALVAFGGLAVAMAVGYDVRVGAGALRSQPALLLTANALTLAVAGWCAFDGLGDAAAGEISLAALAAAHVAVGLVGPRLARVSEQLKLLALSIGIVLADVAFALVLHGWVLALGWAATGVAFAALQRRAGVSGRDGAFVQGGLGGHLALALVQTLLVAHPLAVLRGDATLTAAGAVSVTALAAGCLAAGRLAGRAENTWRIALDATGLAALALLAALTLDGTALVLAWVGEGIVLVRIARRFGDRVAAGGALGFLALASLHALAFEAPPSSLASGLAAPLDALAAVGGVAALALLCSAWLPGLLPEPAPGALRGGAVVMSLYLASGLVVTPFAGGQAIEGELLDAQQQGQLALSVFWTLTGVGALVAGLRGDRRPLRLAALALLGIAVAKVFLLDLATLTSVYRVGSFVALGLLLLAGAALWQRLRPRAASVRGR